MFLWAAQIGPAALIAEIEAVSLMLGGPVSAVVAAILSAVGICSFGDLAYLVIQAAANDQGIYFGIDWNGVFPNPTQGTF